MDSCLYKAVIKRSQLGGIKIRSIVWSNNTDTNEVYRSLRKIYYDTSMLHFRQCINLDIVTDSFGKVVLSEYLLDSVYYKTIQHKYDKKWAEAKIEGIFYFANDTGMIDKPNAIVLKGPPGILIATLPNSDMNVRKREYVYKLSGHINDCRGTSLW